MSPENKPSSSATPPVEKQHQVVPEWEPLLRLIGEMAKERPVYTEEVRNRFLSEQLGDGDKFNEQLQFLEKCELFEEKPEPKPKEKQPRLIPDPNKIKVPPEPKLERTIRFIRISRGRVSLSTLGAAYLET